MYLEEYALRFFALKNNRDAYAKEIGDFLTGYMEAVSDPERATTFDYVKEQSSFEATFRILNEALGDVAFSGFNEKGNPKNYFSALHFEAFTLDFRGISTRSLLPMRRRGKFADALRSIKQDAEFKKLTTGGGKNYSAALNARVAFVAQKVSECLQ